MRCIFRLARKILGDAIDGRNLPGAIPLDRQVLVGDLGENGRDLRGDGILVAGPDPCEIARRRKIQRPDDAVDHRHRDLEAHAVRNDAFLAQGAEHEIRRHRIPGVAEPRARIPESDALHARPHLEIPGVVTRARQQLLDSVDRFRPAQRLEVHPRPALADLAIGNGRQMLRQRAAERPHHLLDRLQRNASDEQQIFTHESNLSHVDGQMKRRGPIVARCRTT
jgi:hypothetical protein